MSLVLCRVDERLIHGQVVVGWGMQLRPTRYVVIDDELAESAWEQDLYALALPPQTPAAFLTVEDGRRQLRELRASEDRTVVLARSLHAMVAFAREGGLSGEEINLGGMHAAPGRTQVTPYLHLSDDERRAVTLLEGEGARVFAQDLPGEPKHPIGDLLG